VNRTRRIVTGHAPDGRSIIVSDAPVPLVRDLPGARFDEVWSTARASEPLELIPDGEPVSSSSSIGPDGRGGSIIRVIDFHPAGAGGARSPMHRTRTIDYGIVIEGEIALILSDSETTLRKGDVVVQRGTDHAWENRSGEVARVVFVLIDAEFAEPLAQILNEAEIIP
jgi:quercetin dioxygenase-like cupin family protein